MNDTGPVWEYHCLPGESTQDGWRETLEPCLESPGCPYRYDIYEISIRVWGPMKPKIKVHGSAYICRNVYNLQRVAFGKGEVDSILQFK